MRREDEALFCYTTVMAEAARNAFSKQSGPVPANDNASSIRGASLRLLENSRSTQAKKNLDRPVLHPLSQMEMARQLDEDKMRDRTNSGGDAEISDDTLKTAGDESDGSSVLDLEPQSYTSREQTESQTEALRQRKQAQTAARFLYPESSASAGSTEPQGRILRGKNRSTIRRQSRTGEAEQQDRFAQAVQAERRREIIRGAQSEKDEMVQKAAEAQQMVDEGKGLYRLMVKIVELESVVLALWVLVALNIETWNILIFRKSLPPSINNKLNLIGLNISVNPEHPFTKMNLVVVALTLAVDLILTLIIAMQVALFLFVVYWLLQAASLFGLLGIN